MRKHPGKLEYRKVSFCVYTTYFIPRVGTPHTSSYVFLFQTTSLYRLQPPPSMTTPNNPNASDDYPRSEKQTNTGDQKTATATAILTDPDFPLPALDNKSSYFQHARSFAVLSVLLAGGIVGTWYLNTSLLQSEQPVYVIAGAFAVTMLALFVTGTVWVDWYELVLGYWWLSIPIGAAAGLALVLNQEGRAGLEEVE